MPLIVRLLGADAISANQTKVLYSVGTTLLGAVVRNVRIVNTTSNPTSGTVNLFFRASGSSNPVRIFDTSYVLQANDILPIAEEITLGPGDQIEASTSVAMEFVVCGVEKT